MMIWARKSTLLIAALTLCGNLALQAADDLPPEAFLRQVAKVGAAQQSASLLSGRLQYYKRNSGHVETYPVSFAIRLTGGETQAFLKLGNECYCMMRNAFLRMHQVFPVEAGALLLKSGIAPDDLVMGFLDGEIISEEAPDTVKTVACRVLNLRRSNGETVRVWIASEYYFPLKAEFYREPESFGDAPQWVRTLELTGFKQIGELYVPTDLAVLAPEFRTRIALKDCEILQEGDERIPALFPDVKHPAKD